MKLKTKLTYEYFMFCNCFKMLPGVRHLIVSSTVLSVLPFHSLLRTASGYYFAIRIQMERAGIVTHLSLISTGGSSPSA